MEPLAASSGLSQLLRPAIPLQSDLGAVLQEGKVLSGEVLERLDGGTILIGLGEHRVAAEAQVELMPGQRFRFQVESRGGELVLRMVDAPEEASQAHWLRAVRSLMGREVGPQRLLAQLAREWPAAFPSTASAARALAEWAQSAAARGADAPSAASGAVQGTAAVPTGPGATGIPGALAWLARAGVHEPGAFLDRFVAAPTAVSGLADRFVTVARPAVEATLQQAFGSAPVDAPAAGQGPEPGADLRVADRVRSVLVQAAAQWTTLAKEALSSAAPARDPAALDALVTRLHQAASASLAGALQESLGSARGNAPGAAPGAAPGLASMPADWLQPPEVLRTSLALAAGASADSPPEGGPSRDPGVATLLRVAQGLALSPQGSLTERPAEGRPGPDLPLPTPAPAVEAAFLAALAQTGADRFESALAALAKGVASIGAVGNESDVRPLLARALTEVAARFAPSEVLVHEGLRGLGAELLQRLAELAPRSGDSTAGPDHPLAGAADPRAWVGREGLLLRALVTAGTAESGTLQRFANDLGRQALAAFEVGEAAGLHRALLELGDGPLRDTLARTMAGLDLEHLLNFARRDAGEPLHFSFPVFEGDASLGDDAWRLAHLFVRWRDERGGAGDGSDGGRAGTWRLAVDVDLSRLGPVHAEIALSKAALSVRVDLERADLVEPLRAQRLGLEALLEGAAGGREVTLHFGHRPRPAAGSGASGARGSDVRYLQDHHLMDVEG